MSVRARSLAREFALKTLYEIEVGGNSVEESIKHTVEQNGFDEDAEEFYRVLVVGVRKNMAEIDCRIARLSHEWALERQPVIDRNILRIASYEMMYSDNIPPAVSINEAVEIAKKYSSAESGRFINGVLGVLLDELVEQNYNNMKAKIQNPAERK